MNPLSLPTLRRKRNWLFLILPEIILVALLVFPGSSFAFFHNTIGSAIGGVLGRLTAGLLLALPAAFLAVAATLLDWAVDPTFIRYPYTCLTENCQAGGTPTIVGIGWPVVRDLANMVLVLALVAIALGTALRIGEYQAKKALPLLIGVLLIINFTPVLLGVIVDGANITINFFLEGFSGADVLTDIFWKQVNKIGGNLNIFDFSSIISFALKLLFVIIWMLLAGVLFLLFAILFIMRRVVIWMLVILSPLAFAAYVLPITRPLFRQWWNQFLQWTIIGVSAAFFLWLSDHMLAIAQTAKFAKGGAPLGFLGGEIQDIINDTLPYVVVLLFMLFGFFMALQTSSIGAQGAIAFAQKQTKRGGEWAKERGAQWGKERGIRTRERFIESRAMTGKKPTWAEARPGWGRRETGEAERGLGAWTARRAATVVGGAKTVAGYGTWTTGRVMPGRVKETVKGLSEEAEIRETEREKEETKKTKKTAWSKWGHIKAASTRGQRIGRILAAVESKQGGDIQSLLAKEYEEEINRLNKSLAQKYRTPEEIKKTQERIGNIRQQIDAPDALVRLAREAASVDIKQGHTVVEAFPGTGDKLPLEMQQKLKIALTLEEKEEFGTIKNKLIARASPQSIENWSSNILIDPITKKVRQDLEEVIAKHWRGNQAGAAARTIGRDFVDELNRILHNRGEEWLKKNNEVLWKWLGNNTAQELGLRRPEGAPPPPAPPSAPPPSPGLAGGGGPAGGSPIGGPAGLGGPIGPGPGGPAPTGGIGPIRPGRPPRRRP